MSFTMLHFLFFIFNFSLFLVFTIKNSHSNGFKANRPSQIVRCGFLAVGTERRSRLAAELPRWFIYDGLQ